MKLREWLDQWSMTGLKISAGFLEMEWNPKDADRDAAWELYVELLTRISTQHLEPEHGDEKVPFNNIPCPIRADARDAEAPAAL